MFDLLLLTGVAGSWLFNLPKWANGDELFARYFLALVLILSFFIPPKRNVISVSTALFLTLAALSVFANYSNPVRGFFSEILTGIVAVKVIADRTSITEKSLGKTLFVFWSILNVLLIAQAFGLIYQGFELAGPFVMPWIMGCAACLSLPFIVAYRRIFVLVLALPILFSHSMTSAAVAVYMFFFSFNFTYGKSYVKKLGIPLIAVLSYIAFFDNAFESTRFGIWVGSFKYIKNLWIGNGIGSWPHMAFYRMNGETPVHWITAHNLYYQVFFEMGFLGVLSLLGIIKAAWIRSHGAVRSSFIALLMLSFLHPIVHFPRFSVFLAVLMAMILRNDGLITQKGA